MQKKTFIKLVLLPILMVILICSSNTQASRFNMSYLYGNYNYSSLVERTDNSLNEVSPSYFDLYDSGNLKLNTVDKNLVSDMHKKGIKVVPFLSNHWDREKGRAALNNIEKLTNQIVDAINKYNLDGINVDIENVTEKDRNNYTLLVKTLREKLGKEKSISVAVAANPYNWQTGWHGSYDYKELAKYADYLMIMTYDEHYEGGEPGPVASIQFVEKSIQYALERVDSSKIVLGIPFFGRYWKTGDNIGGYGVSINRIEQLIEDYSTIKKYDETMQSVKATVTIKTSNIKPKINGKTLTAGTYIFWYENEQSISAKLDLVNKYNLKGTGSWSLGQEPANTWNYYNTKLNQGVNEETTPEIVNPPQRIPQEPSSWAAEAIKKVQEKQWMIGKSDSEFYPKDSLTRAEFATILTRVLGLENYDTIGYTYIDAENHWAKKYISLVSATGYMNGYGDGSFKPDKDITREEIAKVFATIKINQEKIEENIYFKDVTANRWSYSYINKVAKYGILRGYEDGTFKPQKAISREETAVILTRVF